MRDVSDLVEEASRLECKDFLGLIERVGQRYLDKESRSERLRTFGRLVKIPPSGEATVVGDIHGDLESLEGILKGTEFMKKASNDEPTYLIFLGDYGDRGPCSAEVYYVILTLKDLFPNSVLLIRGNHEGPEDLLAQPHDLPYELHKKFGQNWRVIYANLSDLFRRFWTGVIVEGRCIMLHGGVPSKAKNLEDVAYANKKHPSESHLEEILWSDPIGDLVGTYPSPRGAGCNFGKDVTSAFLKMLDVHFLIRGHEPCDYGYKIDHEGSVLTLFSRKGIPYSNHHAAYLTFNLSKDFSSVFQLEPLIYRF